MAVLLFAMPEASLLHSSFIVSSSSASYSNKIRQKGFEIGTAACDHCVPWSFITSAHFFDTLDKGSKLA